MTAVSAPMTMERVWRHTKMAVIIVAATQVANARILFPS